MLRGRFLLSAIFAVVIYLFVFRNRLLSRVLVEDYVPDLGAEPYSRPTSGEKLQEQYLLEYNYLER